MKLDFMRNVKINKLHDTYYTVTATTNRFGKNQVMYEGISRKECEDYIRNYQRIEFTDKFCSDLVWTIKYNHKSSHYYITYKLDGKQYPQTRIRKSDIPEFIREVACIKEGMTT